MPPGVVLTDSRMACERLAITKAFSDFAECLLCVRRSGWLASTSPGIDRLFLRASERMPAQLPAKRVTDLRDDLDLGRVIILRVLELMDRMLVIDRISRKVNQVTCVAAE